MKNVLLVGDAVKRLAEIRDDSVQCCVTSPPYWGLRDYGVEGQIGKEDTPEEYVGRLVEVFREVRRVLHPSGTLWLNLGDSYANDGKWGGSTGGKHVTSLHGSTGIGRDRRHTGLKPKDLVGIPWMAAFALRADGWYLRSDIIWAKGNCMPESVTDRPTKSHEYIFLFTKNQRYFYDDDAIREPVKTADGSPAFRNKRSVWTINPRPFKDAHFAVFPPELPTLCIKAGTSEKGCCPTCGAPWERDMLRLAERTDNRVSNGVAPENKSAGTRERAPAGSGGGNVLASVKTVCVGWRRTCEHADHEPVPCVVLDPFAGSGTTLEVAKGLGREFIGIELNPKYAEMIKRRIDERLGQKPLEVR